MKRTISALLCAGLIAVTFTACSSADSFSDKENLSKNVERNSDTETTFNYSDGAVSAPTEYNSYSSEVSDFELKLFRNYYKTIPIKRVLCLRLQILLSHSDYLQTVPQNKARQILSMR